MDDVDGAELASTFSDVDPQKPSPARIYDFWLGGSQNFEADRAVGRRAAAAMPTLTAAIRANRAFLGRVVRHLVTDLGITQFLDLTEPVRSTPGAPSRTPPPNRYCAPTASSPESRPRPCSAPKNSSGRPRLPAGRARPSIDPCSRVPDTGLDTCATRTCAARC
jgi:hypothetical protein